MPYTCLFYKHMEIFNQVQVCLGGLKFQSRRWFQYGKTGR